MNTIKQQVFNLMDEGITKRAVIYSKIKDARLYVESIINPIN